MPRRYKNAEVPSVTSPYGQREKCTRLANCPFMSVGLEYRGEPRVSATLALHVHCAIEWVSWLDTEITSRTINNSKSHMVFLAYLIETTSVWRAGKTR